MKKIVIAVLIVFAFALVAFAAGPAKMNLAELWGLKGRKAPVVFPHAFHQQHNKCTDCHMKASGGTLKNFKTGKELDPKALVASGKLKPGNMNNPIHKEFCWACHKKKHVPRGTSCSTCHK